MCPTVTYVRKLCVIAQPVAVIVTANAVPGIKMTASVQLLKFRGKPGNRVSLAAEEITMTANWYYPATLTILILRCVSRDYSEWHAARKGAECRRVGTLNVRAAPKVTAS